MENGIYIASYSGDLWIELFSQRAGFNQDEDIEDPEEDENDEKDNEANEGKDKENYNKEN